MKKSAPPAKRTRALASRSLLNDISRMIEETRSAVALAVNAGLTILYWQIGKRIDQEILGGKRAEYGEEIVATLSRQLVEKYGRGYNRRLRRLVLVELKLGKFEAAHKGQMELYLRWLEKHEMEPGESTPLGLILCSESGHEQIELLQLNKTGVRVAHYVTELPPRQDLERQLYKLVAQAKERVEGQMTGRSGGESDEL